MTSPSSLAVPRFASTGKQCEPWSPAAGRRTAGGRSDRCAPFFYCVSRSHGSALARHRHGNRRFRCRKPPGRANHEPRDSKRLARKTRRPAAVLKPAGIEGHYPPPPSAVLPLSPPARPATLSFGGLIGPRARVGSAARLARVGASVRRGVPRKRGDRARKLEKDMRIRRQVTTTTSIAAVLLGLFLSRPPGRSRPPCSTRCPATHWSSFG